ncbi:hypothetical protein CLOP_g22924 [Closterium sp. NIES-67]|nr:hypothetical protein CLOP_g22924 [Closterium sp. NIES-67]
MALPAAVTLACLALNLSSCHVFSATWQSDGRFGTPSPWQTHANAVNFAAGQKPVGQPAKGETPDGKPSVQRRMAEGGESRVTCGRALRHWAVSAVHGASLGIAETAPGSLLCSPRRASCFRPSHGTGQSQNTLSMVAPSLSATHLPSSCPRILLLTPDSSLHRLAAEPRHLGKGGEGGGRAWRGEWGASEEEPEQAGDGPGSCPALPSLSLPGAPLCPCPSGASLPPLVAAHELQLCVLVPQQLLPSKGEPRASPATNSSSSSSASTTATTYSSRSSSSSGSVSEGQSDNRAKGRSDSNTRHSKSRVSSSGSSSGSNSDGSHRNSKDNARGGSRGSGDGGSEEQDPSSEVRRTLDMFMSAAVRLVMQGEHTKAVDIFNKVLEQQLFPDHALMYRGTIYALMNRYQDAVGDFTKALEINPSFHEALRRRGQTYTAMGKNDEAIKDLTAVIEARPTDWAAHTERGIAYFNARFIFQALSDLRTVTTNEPNNTHALFFLAQALMHGGDCAAAIPLLLTVQQRDPHFKGLLVQLGQALKEESRIEEAEEMYRQALAKEPSNLLGYHLYSTLKHGMGYHREAMEIARQGLKSANANDLDLRYMEASCLHALGHFPQAIQAYSAILTMHLPPGVDQTKQFQAFYQYRRMMTASNVHTGLHIRCLAHICNLAVQQALDAFFRRAVGSTTRETRRLAELRLSPEQWRTLERELTAYLAHRRAKPMTAYSVDDDMHPTFKELWAKRIAYTPLFPGYHLQPLRPALKLTPAESGGYNVTFSAQVRRMLAAADELGKRTQYWCNGFLRNRRQHRMAGLAILDVRDMVQETWKRMRREREGEGVGEGGEGGKGRAVRMGEVESGGGSEEGESARGRQRGKRRQQRQQQKQQEQQEQEQGKGWRRKSGASYVRRWRDIYDLVVRWRQLGEPIEPAVWIDKLTRKEFEDGFGSVTAMLVSQLKSNKYYFAFDRAFAIMKQQVRHRHMVWNGYEQPVPLSHTAVHQVVQAETAEDAWKAIGQDYWVVTPCHSTARPGVVMNGTRLTMVKTPTYYEFSIKTPVIPTRWDEYDFEMETAWKELCEAYLDVSMKASDLHAYRRRIHNAILRLGFYWYNFMPMARGTAMVGYVSMLGLFAAADMHVTADIPKGVQVDWEGILTPRFEEFFASLSEWMLPSIDYNSPVFHDLPHISVADALPTLLDVINALSFHEEDNSLLN